MIYGRRKTSNNLHSQSLLLLLLLLFSITVRGYKQYDSSYFKAWEEEKYEILSNYNSSMQSDVQLDDSLSGWSLNCKPKTKYPLHPKPKLIQGKKGIGINLNNDQNIVKLIDLNVYWNYGWSTNRIENHPRSSDFAPMLWGGMENRSMFRKYIDASNLRTNIAKGLVPYVLGFNEPDSEGQANLSVKQAIDQWPVLHNLNVPLVSPSCVNPGSEWMIDFMSNATKNCLRVDYLGVHWYGGTNPKSFKRVIMRYWNLHKMPIIITEFAPADWGTDGVTMTQNRHSPAEVLSFMKVVLPWLERQKFIYGYAWFPFRDTSPHGWSSALYYSNGTITAAGRYYKSVRRNKPNGDTRVRPDPPLYS
jgi:Glycosyl hydrolase catalytic core